jgi:hypothetical protein
VLSARARADLDVQGPGWAEIPFGMECDEQVEQTAAQARTLGLAGVARVVVAVGSGMTLAGLIVGLPAQVPILGVIVGSDPTRRLDRWAPMWRIRGGVDLVVQGDRHAYHRPAHDSTLDGLPLDPYYEAKCAPYLRPGDLFWIVGIRQTASDPEGGRRAEALPA